MVVKFGVNFDTNNYTHTIFCKSLNMNGEEDTEPGEDGLTTLEELEAPDEGPGIRFIILLMLAIVAGIIIIGAFIFWIIGRF
jgi:hypothetical protein